MAAGLALWHLFSYLAVILGRLLLAVLMALLLIVATFAYQALAVSSTNLPIWSWVASLAALFAASGLITRSIQLVITGLLAHTANYIKGKCNCLLPASSARLWYYNRLWYYARGGAVFGIALDEWRFFDEWCT